MYETDAERKAKTRQAEKIIMDPLYTEFMPKTYNAVPGNMTSNDIDQIINDYEKQNQRYRSRLVCLVCDINFHEGEGKIVNLEDLPIDAMKARLAPYHDINPHNLQYYTVNLKPFSGLLLSQKGVLAGSNAVSICNECLTSLKNRKTNNPPKYAIANNLAIGLLPTTFDDLNAHEVISCALTHNSHYISTCYSSGFRVLRTHFWTTVSTPGPVATVLPHALINLDVFNLAIVGAMTKDEEVQARSFFTVRPERIKSFLFALIQANPLYSNVNIVDLLPEELRRK